MKIGHLKFPFKVSREKENPWRPAISPSELESKNEGSSQKLSGDTSFYQLNKRRE